MDNPHISNFTFLALLGTNRNWKAECVMCLADKDMGKSCGCGHTELVVFRPCGHTMCVKNCFVDLMKYNDITLEPTEIKELGFVIPTKPNVDIDFTIPQFVEKKINCPTCRTQIIKTFCAEDIRCELPEYEDYIDSLVTKIWFYK
jgi:hypothetical protein